MVIKTDLVPTEHFMDRGFVVLIALAVAIVLTSLIVIAGLILAYFRHRSEGYERAPTKPSEGTIDSLSPAALFGDIKD